jgi:hypothetical protein
MKTLKLITLILLSLHILSCQAKEKKPIIKNLFALSENPSPSKATIKVALLLDTSNSMDGLIDQAKAQLWKIVNELSYAKCDHESPNLEIALYEYGNDRLEKSDGFIRQVINFSTDLDLISERLFSLTTRGGSEFCGEVIQKSIKDLKWGKKKNDLNIIFIAGNEAFTQGTVSFKNAITDAKEKDVTVNTIFCGDYQNGINGKWREGANIGRGEYMNINHNKRIIHVVTPYDNEIIILNKRLNKTYIYYGSSGRKKYSLQSQQDANAVVVAEEVAVSRAVAKSSSIYRNSTWDLVDAEKEDNFDYKKLKKESLPSHLKNKSITQIKAIVTETSLERKKIQGEIKALDVKRRKYIANNSKNDTQDELESVMIRAIKKQAINKNYSW